MLIDPGSRCAGSGSVSDDECKWSVEVFCREENTMPQALLDAILAVMGLLNSHVPAAGLQHAIDAVSRVLGV